MTHDEDWQVSASGWAETWILQTCHRLLGLYSAMGMHSDCRGGWEILRSVTQQAVGDPGMYQEGGDDFMPRRILLWSVNFHFSGPSLVLVGGRDGPSQELMGNLKGVIP